MREASTTKQLALEHKSYHVSMDVRNTEIMTRGGSPVLVQDCHFCTGYHFHHRFASSLLTSHGKVVPEVNTVSRVKFIRWRPSNFDAAYLDGADF
ncbi:hypothetical protein RRG08_056873 [Elysia crispata]|uniref:Uncharacterized protein n=1 Tax=Elysia crispata TaxID=231223 RepID=A0AAE0ZCK1_9GAST|nr:hypothetical protein RRG08_056873 [Elysia crispata]